MKRWVVIAGLIIVLLGILGGVWFFFKNRGATESIPPQTETEQEETQEPLQEATTSSQPEEPNPYADDKDRDGISNEDEARQGTSDSDFDTDGDALSDSAEMNQWKTDPANPDTDGDGFSDGLEIIKGFNPLGAGKL